MLKECGQLAVRPGMCGWPELWQTYTGIHLCARPHKRAQVLPQLWHAFETFITVKNSYVRCSQSLSTWLSGLVCVADQKCYWHTQAYTCETDPSTAKVLPQLWHASQICLSWSNIFQVYSQSVGTWQLGLVRVANQSTWHTQPYTYVTDPTRVQVLPQVWHAYQSFFYKNQTF